MAAEPRASSDRRQPPAYTPACRAAATGALDAAPALRDNHEDRDDRNRPDPSHDARVAPRPRPRRLGPGGAWGAGPAALGQYGAGGHGRLRDPRAPLRHADVDVPLLDADVLLSHADVV